MRGGRRGEEEVGAVRAAGVRVSRGRPVAPPPGGKVGCRAPLQRGPLAQEGHPSNPGCNQPGTHRYPTPSSGVDARRSVGHLRAPAVAAGPRLPVARSNTVLRVGQEEGLGARGLFLAVTNRVQPPSRCSNPLRKAPTWDAAGPPRAPPGSGLPRRPEEGAAAREGAHGVGAAHRTSMAACISCRSPGAGPSWLAPSRPSLDASAIPAGLPLAAKCLCYNGCL